MSNHALTRKVRVVDLKKGDRVPCDGRVYRDSNGRFVFGIHYSFENEDDRKRHFWKLAQIAGHDARNTK